MGKLTQTTDRSPAEVEAVDLHVGRRVAKGQGQNECADRSRFPGMRSADDRDVAGSAGQIEREGVSTLIVGAIDDREGNAKRRRRHRLERHDDAAQRDRIVQRREPHLMGSRTVSDHPRDNGRQHGRRLVTGTLLGHLEKHSRGDIVVRHRNCREQTNPGGRARAGRGHCRTTGITQRTTVCTRSGHVGRGEPDQIAGVGLEIPRTRPTRQVVRVGYAQHRTGLGGGERLQSDPVGKVAVESPQAPLVEALTGQEQVHVQRPSEPPDRDEEIREFRETTE